MAENTEALIKACQEAGKRLEEGIKSAAQSEKSMQGAIKALEEYAKKGQFQKGFSKPEESAVTEGTFFKGSFGRLEIFLERAQKSAKELESKVKVKKVLDVFKTQKSLDDAKKALAKIQEDIKKSAEALKKFQQSHGLMEHTRVQKAQYIKMQIETQEVQKGILMGYMKKLEVAIESVKKKPSKEEYEKTAFQHSRGLAAAVSKYPKVADLTKTWGALTDDNFINGMKDAPTTLKRIEMIEKAMTTLTQRL